MQELLQTIRSQIKYKIILPYLALMILVMLAGSGIALILVADSFQERFNNYLAQVARNFTGAMAQIEEANVAYLWQIASSPANPETGAPAVAVAMRDRDIAGLKQALEPYFRSGVNRRELVLDRMIAFDRAGQALFDWERSPEDANRITESIATNLAGLELVQQVARGESDRIGDKYSALIKFRTDSTDGGIYFFTVVPVYAGPVVDENLAGGILIASRIDSLLQHLQARSQSAVTTLYDVNGRAVGSTATNIDLPRLDMSPELLAQVVASNQQVAQATSRQNGATATRRDVSVNSAIEPCLDIGNLPGRMIPPNPLNPVRLPSCSVLDTTTLSDVEYQLVYAPLLIRGVQAGYFSVSLARDFVVSAWAASRWAIIAVTLLLALGAVFIGYRVAQQITNPLSDLVQTAEAVTQGQLERRSSVTDQNELGRLSQAFNQMTEHLLRLYTTSRDLNQALEVEDVLAVATRAAGSFVASTEVLVLLEEGDGWGYHVHRAAPEAIQQLASVSLRTDAALLLQLEQQRHARSTKEGLFAVTDESALLETGLSSVAGLKTVLLAPLLVAERLAGVLIFGHAEAQAFGDADQQALTVVANMSVAVLHNAVLYTRVQRDAKERQAILTSIGDGVIVADKQGRIVLVNGVAADMLAMHDWREMRHTVDDLKMERAPQGREIFGSDATIEYYRLGTRVVSRTNAPVIAEDGQPNGTVIVLHDVTAAAAVDQAKTDFIATISHELRTPLTVIRGYVDLILRGVGGPLTPDQAELMEQVRARATDMTGMVNNAIMIADIEAGKLTTDLQPQDILVILESALAPLRPAFNAKGLELRMPDMAIELPPVIADREQLKMVFTQLLDNARRYTQRGSVTVRAYVENGSVRVDIEDTGPGIATDDLNRLFARFQRIEGNNSAERGSGLGLAITKQLIERQGGLVQAVSTLGQGSIFSVVLPQANEQSLAVAQPPEETAASS